MQMIAVIICVLVGLGAIIYWATNKIINTLQLFQKYSIQVFKEDNKGVISFRDAFDKSEMPVITLFMEGVPLNFLVDSGANLNLLDKQIFDNIFPDKVDAGIKYNVAAAGGELKDLGSHKLEFLIECDKYIEKCQDEFCIMDLSGTFGSIYDTTGLQLHGVLGARFFVQNQWRLDFDNLIIWLKK